MKAVGLARAHESAREHVTGHALYTEDLAARLHGLLHAWPVLAPHAHARVLKIDGARAQRVPGFVRLLTAGDVIGKNDVGAIRLDEPLFPEVVMHHAQAVVWVLADSLAAARAAAAAVNVDYEPLEAILDLHEAIEKESFLTEELRIEQGEAAGALAQAPRRLAGELYVGAQEHFYLEGQVALAQLDESGHLLVDASTQHPTETQAIVARVLGCSKNAVTVRCVRMGGAFGGKEVQANPWAAVAALGARLSGRPVLLRLDRTLDMQLTGKRHPFLGRYQVGYDDTGRVLALCLDLFCDGGYSLDLTEPVLSRALFHADNAYRIEHMRVRGRACLTHKTSSTAFRGFGGPQGMLMIEEVMDRVARELGMHPHAVRKLNLYRKGDRTHYGQLVKDAGRLQRIWQELSTQSQFDERWQAVAEHNQKSPHRKRGLAMTPIKFGISFTTSFLNQAGALVLVYQDGSVQVNHGGTEMGQGLHTKMQQIAAQALGVPLTSVRLMSTSTDKVPNTSATAASSGSDMNGAAVRSACQVIRERLTKVAAGVLGVAPSELSFENGVITAGSKSLGFEEVVLQAYLQRVQLFSTGYYSTPNLSFDKASGKGTPFAYYAFGAAVSEVEVDGFTGQYRLRGVDILHDVGDSLSPLIDRGQVEGAFIQGLGWLTLEEVVWDAEGRLQTRGPSTYKLPTLEDCPEHFNVQLLEKATESAAVHGSKAVGEPPFMLAFSAREALRQAIAAFGESPQEVALASPATPEAVFWAIERIRQG